VGRDCISDRERDKLVMRTELWWRNVYKEAKSFFETGESKIDKLPQYEVNGCNSGFDQEIFFLRMISHWSNESVRSMLKQNVGVPHLTQTGESRQNKACLQSCCQVMVTFKDIWNAASLLDKTRAYTYIRANLSDRAV
jgi:hypothetical protein